METKVSHRHFYNLSVATIQSQFTSSTKIYFNIIPNFVLCCPSACFRKVFPNKTAYAFLAFESELHVQHIITFLKYHSSIYFSHIQLKERFLLTKS